jgi:hypothetical protein
MRGTEADRLVVVMKALQWGWSEGAGQARSPIGQPFGGGADGRITVGMKSFEIDKRLVFGAWMKVQANKGAPGVDSVSIEGFADNERDNLYKLWNRMSSGSYFPRPVRAVEIPKPGRYRPPETLLAFLGSL